ncbi:MAG: hypothetical protein ACI4E5_08970 [Suilimivivens sp.]
MKRNTNSKRTNRIIYILLPVLLLLAGGSFALAKYMAQSAKPGIAIATGVYFTGNYAGEASSGDDMADALESIVSVEYRSAQKEYQTFDFEVRNHENILLFNDSNINIPYTISFFLAAEPKAGDSYTLGYKDDAGNNQTVQLTTTSTTPISNTLKGGAALKDTYSITVKSADSSTVPIYVRVTATDVVQKTLKGKMILTPLMESGEFIKSQGFVKADGNAITEFTTVSGQSEFSYKITTGGTKSATGTETLKICWEPTVFDIDRYSAAFQSWRTDAQWKPEALTSSELSEDWANGWSTGSYITIKASSYSSATIGFFRGTDFETKVTNLDLMNKYIHVIKVQ